MPRFFFDLVERETTPDDEGADYADVAAAREAAQASARELMAHRILTGLSAEQCAFSVRDGAGAVVFTYPFEEAIRSHEC